VFVPLDSVTDPGQVLAAIARAAGADLADAGAPAQALAETSGDGTWLLVRQRLGAVRLDQAFAAGSGLSQQQEVAIVRDQRGTGPLAP
jgi:hypothetical protein